jgi:mannose-1-phosphate guanylyltransferase/mannose-1-phosphate guanylyltransferase/phosphomannomutase
MRAMVLAAGLGTRLRPLTHEIPKPMVPVLDRPVMAHIIDLLHRHGITDIIANLHYFPDTIRDYFGDSIVYRYEEELLGTAGGVRNCADFLAAEGEPFLIISGDALTDIDLRAFAERHRQARGIATLAVKRVANTREYGVVLHDSDGRVSGFQEKPDPAEALSDLGNCGIYMFEPEIFDYFPDRPFVDWAKDVFPALLENDVPFYVHEIGEYWNDVGSLDELLQGTFDALTGALRLDVEGDALDEGLVVGDGTSLEGIQLVEPPVWVGRDVRIGANVRLQGPLVIGDEAVIGSGAQLKGAIVFPGTEVADGAILIGGIAGHIGITDSLRRPGGDRGPAG